MICPRCGSDHVNVMTEQVSGKSKTRGKHMGILWRLGRLFLIIMTCGLWLLVGKRKETQKTKMKYKNQTVAICQNCGNKWVVH